MKYPTPEEQKALAKLWDKTGPELERIRKEALRNKPFDREEIKALLALGDSYDGPPRLTSGLMELQRVFQLAAKDPEKYPILNGLKKKE